jgi:hypothetical protein
MHASTAISALPWFVASVRQFFDIHFFSKEQ